MGPYSYSPEPGVFNTNDVAIRSKVGAKEMQTQEARIYRVPPWEWREIKNERIINPNLPALIASSKGHGMVGRRAAGPKSTRHRDTLGNGDSGSQGETSFDTAYRLAINSRILLNLLGDCTGMDFPEDRNVWLRPFKYLVAYETEIRQALQDAESALNVAEGRPELSNQADRSSTTPLERGEPDTDVQERTPHTTAVDASRAKAEMDQLGCLVSFMDSDMQDILHVKHQVSNQTLKEIAFEHLWLLYRPGDLVYTIKSLEDSGTYQAFRVLHVTGGRAILDTLRNCGFNAVHDRSWEEESDTEEKARDTIRGSSSNMTTLIIDCFSIDFDGNRLGPKSRRFVIPTFTGKRKVDALEVCPAFFHPQHEKVRQEMVGRGRRFIQLANGTHKRYSGTSLRESRELWESHNYYWNYVIHDEEVFDPPIDPYYILPPITGC